MLQPEIKLQAICEAYPDEQFLKSDRDFDAAILGVCTDMNAQPRLIYSVKKYLEIMCQRDGMDYGEAREFFDFNVAGAYVGPQTPVWCEDEMLPNGG